MVRRLIDNMLVYTFCHWVVDLNEGAWSGLRLDDLSRTQRLLVRPMVRLQLVDIHEWQGHMCVFSINSNMELYEELIDARETAQVIVYERLPEFFSRLRRVFA